MIFSTKREREREAKLKPLMAIDYALLLIPAGAQRSELWTWSPKIRAFIVLNCLYKLQALI